MKNIRGVALAEDEVVIREYEASNLEELNAKGYVIATNRRLIFTGSTKTALGNSLIVRDTKIDSITGMSGGLTNKKSLMQLIIGVVIALIGLVIFSNSMLFGVIILAIGGFIAYKGLKSRGVQMHVSILSSESSPAIHVAVEASKGFFSRIKSNDAFLTVYASGPGNDTTALINEIGALIQDIQTMGDLAIDKWKNAPKFNGYTEEAPVYAPTVPVASAPNVPVNATPVQPTQPAQPTQQTKSTPQSVFADKCSCGNPLEENARFCNECGKAVEQDIFA